MPYVACLCNDISAVEDLFWRAVRAGWYVQTPLARKSHWWHLNVWLPSRELAGALESLPSMAAVVWVGSHGNEMLLRSTDADMRLSMGANSSVDAGVSSWRTWVEMAGLKPPRVSVAESVWRLAGEKEPWQCLDVLAARSAGLLPVGDPLPWRELGQATGGGGGHEQRPFVGLTLVNWELTRWPIARTGDLWGVWDRDAPAEPLRTWPASQGQANPRKYQHQLIDQPILDATALPGERAWAQLGPAFKDGQAVVHFGPDHRVSIFIVKQHDLYTNFLMRPDIAHIALLWAKQAGWDVSNVTGPWLEMPTDSLGSGLTVADVCLHPHRVGSWNVIPEEVHRGLLQTADWVRGRPSP
jgi:hypothetical protein